MDQDDNRSISLGEFAAFLLPATFAASPSTPQSVREHQDELARKSLAEERQAETERRERRNERLTNTMSDADLAAIERMQTIADQDANREFIAKTLLSAKDDGRLTLKEVRERDADIALETRQDRLEQSETPQLSVREVDDSSVVFVRGVPAAILAGELLRPFEAFGTIIGWYRHQVLAWKAEEHSKTDPRDPDWKPLTTWGLVAFTSKNAVDAILATESNVAATVQDQGDEEAEEDARSNCELHTHRSNMRGHLRLDIDGKLWDAWRSLLTCRLSSIPASKASESALCEFLITPTNSNAAAVDAPAEQIHIENVTMNHGWSVAAGDVDGDALVTCVDLQSLLGIQNHRLVSTEPHQVHMGKLLLRIGDDSSDTDAFSMDPRCAALDRRKHKSKLDTTRRRRGATPDAIAFTCVNPWEVQLMLAETCMQTADYYNARKHYQAVLGDSSVHQGTPTHRKATEKLQLAETRYTSERKKTRADARGE